MSIWHEVHCDVNSPNCHSSVNNNPSAWTKAYAVQKARAAGWKIGRRAVCPGCQKLMTPDQVIAGRLSEAQKRILMDPRFDPKGWEPADPYNKHLVPMVDAGLFARRDGRCGFEAFKDAFIVPTDLGISIRQALLQEERS